MSEVARGCLRGAAGALYGGYGGSRKKKTKKIEDVRQDLLFF